MADSAREGAPEPLDLELVVRGQFGAALRKHRVDLVQERARTGLVARARATTASLRRVSASPYGSSSSSSTCWASSAKYRSAASTVAAVELDMAQVVQVDDDHPVVADAPVEVEAQFEHRRCFVVALEEPRTLRVLVQRPLARGRDQRLRVPAGRDSELERLLVLACGESRAAESDVSEGQRFGILRTRGRPRAPPHSLLATRRGRPAGRRADRPRREPAPAPASARRRGGRESPRGTRDHPRCPEPRSRDARCRLRARAPPRRPGAVPRRRTNRVRRGRARASLRRCLGGPEFPARTETPTPPRARARGVVRHRRSRARS